jgi:chloramphenicol-sensitive protein RarD
MQYISPTLPFALGVWFFEEPFDGARLTGFVAIWIGLALYTGEASWQLRQVDPPVTA